jgi:hypothetical protein
MLNFVGKQFNQLQQKRTINSHLKSLKTKTPLGYNSPLASIHLFHMVKAFFSRSRGGGAVKIVDS